MSVVHKKAPGAQVAGLTFVLSDATVDRYGDVVEPRGWDLRNFKGNPIALFNHNSDFPLGNWKNLRVENDQLVGELEPAKRGTSPRIDELLSLIDQRVLRAVSVGFKPIDAEPRPGGKGTRFKRQELLEVSVVSVPALPTALAVARSLHVSDDTIRMAFGEHAGTGEAGRRGLHGENAATPTSRNGTVKMALADRIRSLEESIVAKRDRLNDLTAADILDLDAIEEINVQIEKDSGDLAGLKKSEANLAAGALLRAAPSTPAAPRRPLGLSGRDSKPSDALIRSAIVSGVALHMNKDPLDIYEKMYGHDEATGIMVKAAVAPATTTSAGWAAELINTAMDDFIETLRPASVYPALAAAGGGRLTFGPNAGAIKIGARSATPSIGGSFIGEGAAIPVRRLALTSVTLTPRKMGVITTFTREMARYSSVQLETLLRTEIVNDTAITLDSVLLGNGAADAVAPAGLLNGVTPLTPTSGGGAAAFLGDIRKLLAPFVAANAAGGLMLLMNPGQAEGLDLTPGPDGALGWADRVLARYGIATSTAIPLGRVIMVRAADFASATGDVPEFELSNDATVHMEDAAPLAIGTAGTPTVVAAPVRSFFQTGVSGLRMLMDVTWSMRRPGVVQTIDGVTW